MYQLTLLTLLILLNGSAEIYTSFVICNQKSQTGIVGCQSPHAVDKLLLERRHLEIVVLPLKPQRDPDGCRPQVR